MLRRNAFLLLLTAAFVFFSFPPFPTGFLATIALVPFMMLLDGKKPVEGLRLGYATGLVTYGILFYWLNWNSGATQFQATGMYVGTVFYLSLAWGIFGWMHTWLLRIHGRRAYAIMPFLWTSLDFLQSLGELGFSWQSLATSHTGYTAAVQFISITGMYGLTLWIAILNVLALTIIRRTWIRSPVVTMVLTGGTLVLPWAYGGAILWSSGKPEATLRTIIIQPNIEPNRKWIERNFAYDEMMRLTRSTKGDRADLILWPETAIPNRLRNEQTKLDEVVSEIRGRRVSLLTGIPDRRWIDRDGEPVGFRSYNSVFLLRPDDDHIQTYDKIHLVPFGEHVPGFLMFMKDIAMDVGVPDYEAGREAVVFTMPIFRDGTVVDSIRIAPVICLESVFSHMVRACVTRGAQMLIIVTNDAWYDGTTGPAQHNRIAVLRAVENRIPVARCANSGISSIIDPYGRIVVETLNGEQAILKGDIPLSGDSPSFFSELGWLFPWLVLGMTCAVLVSGAWISIRKAGI